MNQFYALFQSVIAALAEGAYGILRMTAYRALHINLRSADGTEAGTVANPILVSGGGGAFGGPVTQATVPWVVDGSGFTQPVSIASDVGVTQSTSPWVVSLASTTITGTVVISAVSLPLPTGAATEATLTTLLKPADTLTKVTTVDTITNPVAVTQSTSPWVVSLASTTITGTVAVTQSGAWTVSVTGVVDVSGSSVSVSNFPATQDVNLTEVGGVAVALGQTTMSASVPVVIASDQTVPISGTVTADASGVFSVNPTLPLNDGETAQLALDDLGRLRVIVEDSPRTRHLLESILIELQMLNANFREVNNERMHFEDHRRLT